MEDLVLERLKACALEIEGVVSAFTTPPDQPIDDGDLPCAYALIGPTLTPTAQSSSGVLTVVRTFVQRLLITPLLQGINDPQAGAESNVRSIPFFNRFAAYYHAHPELYTATLPPLLGCHFFDLEDSGLVTRLGPGNVTYAAIDFTLVITMSQNVIVAPAPYFE